ncbi:hypothetical protein Vafri_12397, partial [Volvox africanus]
MKDWGGADIHRYGILTSVGKSKGKMPPGCIPVVSELHGLEEWCRAPYNFAAGGTIGVSESTYRGIKNTVSKFLGFAHQFLGVPLPYLSLRLFSNQHITINFIDFMVARAGRQHTAVEITRLVKLVEYLRQHDARDGNQTSHCQCLQEWLHNIGRQLKQSYPRAPPPAAKPISGPRGVDDEDVAQDDSLPDKSEVLAFVQGLQQSASDALKLDLISSAKSVSLAAAITCMHALVAVLLSGLYLPPLRMSALSTLMVPGSTSCCNKDCRQRACRGNNLTQVVRKPKVQQPAANPSSGPSCSTGAANNAASSVTCMQLELNHHKTARFAKNREPLTVILPPDLSKLIQTYVRHARPVLMQRAPAVVDDMMSSSQQLLIDKNGQPFNNGFAMEWRDIEERYGAPWEHIPPQKLRHIHSTTAYTSLVQEVARQLPDLQPHARVMGNSLRVWGSHYIQRPGSIVAQAGVDNLNKWRKAQLGLNNQVRQENTVETMLDVEAKGPANNKGKGQGEVKHHEEGGEEEEGE